MAAFSMATVTKLYCSSTTVQQGVASLLAAGLPGPKWTAAVSTDINTFTLRPVCVKRNSLMTAAYKVVSMLAD